MSQTFNIPRQADFSGIAALFHEGDQTGAFSPDSAMELSVGADSFLRVDGLAYLTARCLDLAKNETVISLAGDPSVVRYLERMDFHAHLGLPGSNSARHSELGRFLPIRLIREDKDVFDTTNSICDLVLRQFDDAARLLPAMEWMVNELIDNVIIHAESPVPGVVCAQFYPKLNKLDVSICDMGRGIRESLSTGHQVDSHGHALEQALKRGVTRDPSVGMGYGMAGSLEISRVNGGDFLLWSGDAWFTLKDGNVIGIHQIPTVKGTGLSFSMRTDHPVDLAKTWIGGGDWSFIDSEAQRLGENGGLDIAAECASMGSRPPGKYLRRKIAALLPEMEEPLLLNFSNVRFASSSFLDELLGRLAFEFGKDVFKDKVQLVGMKETIRKLANVVIAQRTGEIELNMKEQENPSTQAETIGKSTQATNGWLIRAAVDKAQDLFSVTIPLSGGLFSGMNAGDGLAIVGSNGDIIAFARLFRKREGLEETHLYFSGMSATQTTSKPVDLGLNAGAGVEVALRQPWPAFEAAMKTATGVEFTGLPSFSGATPAECAYLRSLLQSAVTDDLLGPANGPEEEVVGMSVRDRYLLGKLAPKDTMLEADQDDDLGGGDEGDEGVPEVDASKTQTLVPSSVGMTFCISGEATELEIEARWGRYERRESETATNDKTGKPLRAWKRIPSGGKTTVPIVEGGIGPLALDPETQGIVVQGMIRAKLPSGDRLVTLFLLNNQAKPEENQDAGWAFQPELIVRDPEGTAVFRRRPVLEINEGDDADMQERLALEMVYRKRVEFAVGHGVAVHAETSPSDVEQAREISTVLMPDYEVQVTETPGLDPDDRPSMKRLVSEGFLDMQKLADLPREELLQALAILADDYKDWIDTQAGRSTPDLTRYAIAKNSSIQRCREIQARLVEGINVLAHDDHALESFRFANRSMATQRVRSIYSLKRRRGEDVELASLEKPGNRSWRPFQLAFVLLSIPALADPTHADRTEPMEAHADLLWFPTGGGKTEAYLGVAAFTMAIRRLQGTFAGYDGTRGLAVIMRYTLRLLTIQQFQRATALLCAMETLRKKDIQKWGKERFTLGLWVGNKVTPGTTAASNAAIEDERDGKRKTGATPAQLTFCPWCGAEINPGRDVHVDTKAGRTAICCGDKLSQCEFSKAKSNSLGLPVVVVDEEIYHRPPTMMIGTVDKFAMMAWRGQIRTLFGRVGTECARHGLLWPGSECNGNHNASGPLPRVTAKTVPPIRPPDLIIQDEFHLISGPLGTMVGLYETAVDELSAWQYNGKTVRPKVIASTATVRKAREQVHNVFLRKVSVFPPNGLDIEDNFFSVQRKIEDKPGRLYVGVCSPGSSRPAVLIRLYAALLTAAQSLFDQFGQASDPYMTVVGYFNSLRELGGMRRLAEDDVQTRAYRVQMGSVIRPGLSQRSVSIVEELTSRVSSKDIPKKLDHLEVRFRKAWEKNETRAIDVVLATNMLSVGVDVNRIGLMAVNGQPKSTAEYIQATSRVGRAFPGIVFTVLTWSRPRDLSHYESFEHYHATFYKHVEAQSVTPFAPRAMDRGLTGTLVSLLRLSENALNPNQGAATMDSSASVPAESAKDLISDRAWKVSDKSSIKNRSETMVSSRIDRWVQEASRPGRVLGYETESGVGNVVAFLKKPGIHRWDEVTVPMSMREVEAGVNLVMDSSTLGDGPAWVPQTK